MDHEPSLRPGGLRITMEVHRIFANHQRHSLQRMMKPPSTEMD
jgi:hypothetical protein